MSFSLYSFERTYCCWTTQSMYMLANRIILIIINKNNYGNNYHYNKESRYCRFILLTDHPAVRGELPSVFFHADHEEEPTVFKYQYLPPQ